MSEREEMWDLLLRVRDEKTEAIECADEDPELKIQLIDDVKTINKIMDLVRK